MSAYVEKMGITLRTAAGFSAWGDWGVTGIPAAALIDPEGVITWAGHPGELSSGKVKDALKGAKGGSGGFLGFSVARELDGKLKGAVKSAADGKLGKAHADALALAIDETLEQALRDEAQGFADEVLAYATLLRNQGEAMISKRLVLEGLEVFEALEGALKGMELQAEVSKRLAEIANDKELQTELEAAEALQKALEAAEKRGMKKALSKFEAVVKKYPGTKAADRAQKKIDA